MLHDSCYMILLGGYLLNYLPFIGISRVMFLYHYIAALIFAILILAGAILIFSVKQEVYEKENIQKVMISVLNEMAKDVSFREDIINDGLEKIEAEDRIKNLLKERFPNSEFDYNVIICNINDADCKNEDGAKDIKKEVFSQERLISASLKDFMPKIVRIYIWRR